MVEEAAWIVLMAQRAIRLEFRLHRVNCPHCATIIEYNTTSAILTDVQTSCLKCRKDFLVVAGVGKPLKKRPHRAGVN
jgi:hypothetical protein